jgi:Tyrosine-protein kinase ephrin type A/B receptor-like
VLGGLISTQLLWPINSIPAIMTICSVSRYTGTIYNGEHFGYILTGFSSPDQATWFSHGFYRNKRGVATYVADVTQQLTTVGYITDWLVMCGTSGGAVPNNVIIDQLSVGTALGVTNTVGQLSVNYETTERSTFELHSVYIWPAVLSAVQMKQVTTALRAQIGGSPDSGVKYQYSSNVVSMIPAPTAYEQVCTAGSFADSTTGDCMTPCLAGTYSADGYAPCTNCLAGTNKTDTGVGTCAACGVNTYSLAVAANCTACPANTFSAVSSPLLTSCTCLAGYTGADGVACTACPAGTFKTTAGAGSCLTCDSNAIFSVGSVGVTPCKCNAGYTVASDGAACSACLAGTFKSVVGNQTCSVCPSLKTSTAASDEWYDCKCLPGYTADWDLVSCTACAEGSYKNITGWGPCTTCPLNTYSVSRSEKLTDCKCNVGYTGVGGGVLCTPCPTGSYKDTIGSGNCTACPEGTYSTNVGAGQCTLCPLRTSSVTGCKQLSDCKCVKGSTAVSDGVECTLCTAGTYKSSTGTAACTLCPSNGASGMGSIPLL